MSIINFFYSPSGREVLVLSFSLKKSCTLRMMFKKLVSFFFLAFGIALALVRWMVSFNSHRINEKQEGLNGYHFHLTETKRPGCGCRFRLTIWAFRTRELWKPVHGRRGVHGRCACRESGSQCRWSGCCCYDSQQAECCHSSLLHVLFLSDASRVRTLWLNVIFLW